MCLSLTRRNFRAALADVHRYTADSPDRGPAFRSSPGELTQARRPLKDMPSPRKSGTHLDTVAGASQEIREGRASATSLAKSALEAIKRRNPELNAFSYLLPDQEVLSQAALLDEEQYAGRLRGPLHGIPVTVKDVIHVAGMPTTASSKVLSVVPREDAVAVGLLRRAKALILGKTQTHEFALGLTTPQSRNPHDVTRDPGGSSGGSAIAVATGMGLASLGTDTRASIRVPAALCGVVGYKPTFGLVPTEGIVTLSWSLDHVAPMARTVQDIAILLNVLSEGGRSGPGRGDTDYTQWLNKDMHGLRIALPKSSLGAAEPDVLRAFQSALNGLRSRGAVIVETEIPDDDDFTLSNSMGMVVSRCEAAAYHRTFKADPSLYTRQVYEQLDEALRVSAADYVQSQRWRAAFQERMLGLLSEFDALLMPTCRVAAPKSDDTERFLFVLSQNCIPWSFIGFPAISVPCGTTSLGLPVGAELVAGPWEDGRLISMAAALESALEPG